MTDPYREERDELRARVAELELHRDAPELRLISRLEAAAERIAALEADRERWDHVEAHPEKRLDCISGIWCFADENDAAPDKSQGGTAREAVDSDKAREGSE